MFSHDLKESATYILRNIVVLSETSVHADYQV